VNPFLRDLQRQLTTPSAWICILLLVATAGVLAAASAPPSGSNRGGQFFAVTATYSTGYEFEVYVYTGAGTSVGGALVTIVVSQVNGTGPPVGNASAVTSDSGLASLSVKLPDAIYSVNYSVYSDQGTNILSGDPLGQIQPGQVVGLPEVFSVVNVGDFSLTPYLLVAFPEPEGAPVAGLSIQYTLSTSVSYPVSTPTSYNGSLGGVTSTPELFHVAPPPGANPQDLIEVFLTNATGAVLASQTFNLGAFSPEPGAAGSGGETLQAWLVGMAFLVPLVAVFIAYLSYARDRVSGALEPVVALPFSRLRVMTFRLLSGTATLAIGVTASVAVLWWSIVNSSRVQTPFLLAGATWIALMGEGVALLAIVFLLSHLSKSHATVLAGALGVTIVATFLWGVVAHVIGALTQVPYTVEPTFAWQGAVGVFSPAQVALNPVQWSVHYLAPDGSQLFPASPDPVWGALAVILWIALPLAGAAWLARHRD
jgi:ABC-type transport system involved in multi-copper enzyme maturation permease subunit